AEARREELALAELQARGPLKEESIRLAYADPEDVARTLQGMLGFAVGAAPPPGAPGGPPLIPAPPFSVLYGVAPPPPVAPAPMPTAEVLAKGITIQAHKPTNSIFIRHYEADLERIKKVIREKLDVPLPQVKITARLNELNRGHHARWHRLRAHRSEAEYQPGPGRARGGEQDHVAREAGGRDH